MANPNDSIVWCQRGYNETLLARASLKAVTKSPNEPVAIDDDSRIVICPIWVDKRFDNSPPRVRSAFTSDLVVDVLARQRHVKAGPQDAIPQAAQYPASRAASSPRARRAAAGSWSSRIRRWPGRRSSGRARDDRRRRSAR